MKKLRILLADDHEIVRDGVRRQIEREPAWEVCGEADDGRKAVALAEQLKPDIVVLDMGMPELNGLEATRQIKRALPKTEVLVFTGEESEQVIHEIFAAGARSYIFKSDRGQHLVAAIRALGGHKHYFTNRISEVVFARYFDGESGRGQGQDRRAHAARARDRPTTHRRQKQQGRRAPCSGSASRPWRPIAPTTMRKLRLDSFADLVRYAIRNKIIAA